MWHVVSCMTQLLYPHGRVPDIQWSEEWLGPRADLETMEEKLSLAQPLNRPRHPHIFLLGLHKKNNLRHSGTNHEDQVAYAPKFYTVAPHSCGSSDHITLLARGILGCLLGLLYNMFTPTLRDIPYWPLFTETNPTDFPTRNSLGISVTPSAYLWQIKLCTSSWHLSSPVRPQLKSGNNRRQGVAVTSASNCPTN